MKKEKVLYILIILVLILAVAVSRIDNHETKQKHIKNNPNSLQPKAVSSLGVSITNFALIPPIIKIKKGNTVIWTNEDTKAHTITDKNNKNGPNSPLIPPNSIYQFTFNKPGNYSYLISTKPLIGGTVIVSN